MAERRLLLAAPRARMPDLAELADAWRDAGVRVERAPFDSDVPDLHALIEARSDLDAALVVGPVRRAPATVLRAPFALDRRGRRVPVAWLPVTSPAALARFAATAARVHRRDGYRTAVAVLGQWHPRYLRVAERVATLLERGVPTFRWTSDVITREGMVEALGSGLALGVYIGHGRPAGWVGYHGTRRHHFDGFAGEPLGALLSLCCRTASRRRVGLSYAEAIPLQGVAAASFGATGDTLHRDNTSWAVGFCSALASGASNVGELIVRAAPPSPSAVASYRLFGDPLAPLTPAAGAVKRATAVPTYN
jgi:hypothetical protein